MSETTGTPALNESLAKFQAALPRVGKDNTAKVKSDKANYTYKYADLADISQVALPLLGQFGLAFTAKPTTLPNGAFVLHYKLTHSSGEQDEGFYKLPDPDRNKAQEVGSAITYARRYCLCAVTGIHPDGEDDDGAAAQNVTQSASAAWETATPARPRQQPNGNGRGNGHRNGTERQAAQQTGELDPDAQEYADEAHEAQALSALRETRQRAEAAGKTESLVRNPATGRAGILGPFLDYHERRLAEIDEALAGLQQAAEKAKIPDQNELDIKVKEITGAGILDATAAQLRQATEALVAVPS